MRSPDQHHVLPQCLHRTSDFPHHVSGPSCAFMGQELQTLVSSFAHIQQMSCSVVSFIFTS